MLIKRILIENYRSIKKADIQLKDITALVGPNNAGKTNILSAINFLLGERYPSRQGLDSTDFYNKDLGREILIQIWFDRNPDEIETMWATCRGGNGRLEARLRRTWGREEYLSNEIRDKLALVYLDAARSFDAQFSNSRWSLFGRIVRQLDEDFRNSASEEAQSSVINHLSKAQELLKTPLYRCFEAAMTEAFQGQIRRTTHCVTFDFRTFDPLNFYKSLYPTLIEGNEHKNPSEAGSGIRNLIVMALFRAYAQTFRGNAVIAIEEPEIYLHPHAQRSLAALFEDLAANGSQILYSTHSATFIDVARSDRVILVERCPDGYGDTCTQVRTVSSNDLLEARKTLHPSVRMTVASMQERYRNICGLEHAEAFFSKAILLVEGPTEKEAIPIYACHIGMNLDALGISVVSANGKRNLDQLFQLYQAHGFPVFIVFDNDRGGEKADIRVNSILTKMLGLPESDMPDSILGRCYCIVEGNYEKAMEMDLEAVHPGLYAELQKKANEELGPSAGKALIARYMAHNLVKDGIIPALAERILNALNVLLAEHQEISIGQKTQPSEDFWDDDIPF